MAYPLATVLIVPGTPQTVQLLHPQITQALKVSNKSYYDLQYGDFGTQGIDWIPAGTEYMLYASVQNQGDIYFNAVNNANISPVTSGPILITEYITGEELPKGQWPISIPYQNVSANLSITTAQYVKDDVDSAGTVFVESTVSGDASSSVSITNDGKLTLGTTARAGQLFINNGFGVDNTGIDASGNVNVGNGSHITTNAINANALNDLALNVNAGQRIVDSINGVPTFRTDVNGANLLSGSMNFIAGSLTRIKYGSGTTGAGGNVTITHGLGTTPAAVFLTETVNVNDIMSVTSVTSTTFVANASVAAARQFYWIAIA